MRVESHVLGGMSLSLALFPEAGLVPAVVAGAAAVLPDIDHGSSYIGRKLPGISHLFQFVVGHRALFHSPFFVLVLAGVLFGLKVPFAVSIVIGYISHLLLDSLTPSGIPFLFPISGKGFGLPLITTRGYLEPFVMLGLFVWLGYQVYSKINFLKFFS